MGIPNFEIGHLDSQQHCVNRHTSVGITTAMVFITAVGNDIYLDD